METTPLLKTLHTRDALRLRYAVVQPVASKATVVLTHGLGQNRLAWTQSLSALDHEGFAAIALDARGHGDSDWCSEKHYELDQFVDDLIELIGIESPKRPVIYVGASMGGLLGLLLTQRRPDLIAALVLVDVTPRWEAEGVNRIFQFMRAYPEGFVDLQAAQNAVQQYLPHREAQAPERLAQHLRPGDDGRLHWHWDPALLSAIETQANHYTELLENAARSVRCPLLLLTGALSDVVSTHTIAAMLKLAPHAQHQRIADATHMVTGDRQDRFQAAILDFLGALSVSPSSLSSFDQEYSR